MRRLSCVYRAEARNHGTAIACGCDGNLDVNGRREASGTQPFIFTQGWKVDIRMFGVTLDRCTLPP